MGTDEYEYWLRIPADTTSSLAAALDTDIGGIVDAWEAQVQEIAAHGVSFTFHSDS